MRLAWFAVAVAVAACGTSTDDRPLTVQYVTDAILRPTCGGAACHSSFATNRGYVLDTVDGVRSAVLGTGGQLPLVGLGSVPAYDPDNPGNSEMIRWLTETDPDGKGIGRMPYDAPMPNEDIRFLENWIAAAAPGAQCDPDQPGGMGCNNMDLHVCNSDWTFGALVMTCPTSCSQGLCQ
ncbi:MAG TPA: hypothetical protein VMJ10_22680 [Kofleriaceae bacterium]|nr:hypothetical protein [Kofleriaceae bacterium]